MSLLDFAARLLTNNEAKIRYDLNITPDVTRSANLGRLFVQRHETGSMFFKKMTPIRTVPNAEDKRLQKVHEAYPVDTLQALYVQHQASCFLPL